jgi:hypothetical protein
MGMQDEDFLDDEEEDEDFDAEAEEEEDDEDYKKKKKPKAVKKSKKRKGSALVEEEADEVGCRDISLAQTSIQLPNISVSVAG